VLRRLARGRGGIGRAGSQGPERRVWAARALALFGVLGMALGAAIATWPVDVVPRAAANAAGAEQVAAPDLLFPKPSLGPPRQFPLKPTPSPTPTRPAPPPPPSTPPPRPSPPQPPAPSSAPPTPSPSQTPSKTPVPRPARIPPLPAAAYHVPPHKQLSRVLVVFVVGIVPVSLARVRR
jgi:hypothetical protein